MKNYFEVNDDHLCGAVSCFEKPTMEIKLKVGQEQTITVHVCAKCVNKFGIKPQQTGIDAGACDSVCSGCVVDPRPSGGDDLDSEAKMKTEEDHAKGKPSSETLNKAKVKTRDALT